jgi:hypothetical protein
MSLFKLPLVQAYARAAANACDVAGADASAWVITEDVLQAYADAQSTVVSEGGDAEAAADAVVTVSACPWKFNIGGPCASIRYDGYIPRNIVTVAVLSEPWQRMVLKKRLNVTSIPPFLFYTM